MLEIICGKTNGTTTPNKRATKHIQKRKKKKKSKKKRDANAMHPPVRYFDNRKDLSDNIVQQVFEYYFSI